MTEAVIVLVTLAACALLVWASQRAYRRQLDREWEVRERAIRRTGVDPKTGHRSVSDAEFNQVLAEFDRELARLQADIAKRRAAKGQTA